MRSAAWPDVRVACLWIAQLPLRVEILRHPAGDGRPLVLGGAPGERKVVQLCSPEAEAAGVWPGLPLREVVPLCPGAIVLQPDPVRTASVLEAVLADLQRVSPLVEPGEGDDGYFFLDLRGLQGMYGELAALEEAIRAAVPPLLRPRLGFANGKFAAAVAARLAEPGLSKSRVVPASETRAFLAPLSVRHLVLLEPEALQRMELLGVRTIGDLAALPFNAVQAQFGMPGAHAWRLAHGKDPDPFVARARQLAEIADAARQLRARYGRVPLYHAVEVEPWSRIPERRWALVTCDL